MPEVDMRMHQNNPHLLDSLRTACIGMVEHLSWGFLQINNRNLFCMTEGEVLFHNGSEFWELLVHHQIEERHGGRQVQLRWDDVQHFQPTPIQTPAMGEPERPARQPL